MTSRIRYGKQDPCFNETDVNIWNLIHDCYETSKSKGWWDDQLNGNEISSPKLYLVIPEKLSLIHSEISEALEDYRVGKMTTAVSPTGKPEGFYSELADVVIRIFDLLGAGANCHQLGAYERDPLLHSVLDLLNPEERAVIRTETTPYVLNMMHDWVSLASHAHQQKSPEWGAQELLFVVRIIMERCESQGVHLWSEVEQKMAYNKTRTHRHGGKVC